MRDANLFILGVQKCGTTSLASHLNSHPEIFVPSVKEMYHFCLDENYRRGNDRYEKEYFAPKAAETARYRVDATPFYLASETALERIAEYSQPQARFLVILRDPVARAISAYRHQIRLGNEDMSLEDALDAEPTRIAQMREAGTRWWRHAYVTVGRYGEQLERAFDIIGRERILIISQQAFGDAARLNRELVAFLGLGQAFPSTEIPRKNQASMPRSRLVRSLITRDNPLKSFARIVVPREMRSRIGHAINTRNARPAEKFEVAESTRTRLVQALEPDQARLAGLGIRIDVPVSTSVVELSGMNE